MIQNGSVGSSDLADAVSFGNSTSDGYVAIWNAPARGIELTGSTGGAGYIGINNSTGTKLLAITDNTGGGGHVSVKNSAGNNAVILNSNAGDDGDLRIVNTTGKDIIRISSLKDGSGFVDVYNSSGTLIADIFSSTDGSGIVNVYNSSGQTTIQLDGSRGIVFGSEFVEFRPNTQEAQQTISYNSLEGPEVAIYTRGKGNLVSGRTFIQFPDHFSSNAVVGSITVTLTPRSAESKGLAAVEVSAKGIRVVELNSGTGSYAFDYVAYAVRKGFEKYEIYAEQPKIQPMKSTATKNETAKDQKKKNLVPKEND